MAPSVDALHPADQADLVSGLQESEQVTLLTQMDPSESADVLEEMHDVDAAAVAEMLSPSDLAGILDEMAADAAADRVRRVRSCGVWPQPMATRGTKRPTRAAVGETYARALGRLVAGLVVLRVVEVFPLAVPLASSRASLATSRLTRWITS